MAITTFDLSVCIRCGLCAQVCPVQIIIFNDEKYPYLSDAAQVHCIQCGHCEAVCSVHAALVTGEELVDAAKSTGSTISSAQFAEYCMKRRSIRRYKKEPVERATLERLLDITRYAPSGINRQPVQWVVLYNSDTVYNAARTTIDWMRQIVQQNPVFAAQMAMNDLIAGWDAQVDTICRSAPHCIIAHAHKDDRIASTDGVIALSHLELAAPSFGLGACWAGYLNIAANMHPALKDAMDIPQDHTCIGCMLVGNPAVSYARIPKRKAASVLWTAAYTC